MTSKTFLFLALFASTVTVILSIPQIQLAVEPPQEPEAVPVKPEENADPNILVADNMPQYNPKQPRVFGSLLNLSAYLQGAPQNSAALNFIPLITILSALG